MSEQIYKDFFEEAMNQIREEYIANGKERDFKFYFNLEYIEDTFDTITISVPSEFMWKQMTKNGSAEKIQQKINELTAQEIKLIPIPKNSTSSTKKPVSVEPVTQIEPKLTFKFQPPVQDFSAEIQADKLQTAKTSTPQKTEQEKNEATTTQKSGLSRFQQAMQGLNEIIEKEKLKESRLLQQNEQTNGSFIQNSTQNNPYQWNAQAVVAQTPTQMPISMGQNQVDYNVEYQQFLTNEVMKMQQRKNQINHPMLRDDYTFDNFIPGAGTQYAYNAAKRAAEAPGKDFNPILIYGGVGLGKTHLMQAIGNQIFSENNNAKISYISAESFTNEFTASLRSKKTEEFKKKYRSLDVLLLDDIQFLVDKEATQEELFHTFNAIYDRKGQLVFTCDRPIAEIKGITDRLRTRFSRGLNIDLQPPDYETRRAILEQKMNSKGKKIPLEVLDYIAQNIQSNVRDLESCMMKMIGYCELVEQELTIEIAKDLLKDRIDAEVSMGSVSVESIQQAVVKHYGLKITDLIGKKKSKQYVLPRQIAIFLCRKLVSEYSLKDIGNEFGGRDHTTIMDAFNKIGDLIKTNAEIAGVVKQIEKEAREIN